MKLAAAIMCLQFCCLYTTIQAQIETVQLDEVTIEALPFEKFVTGSKVEKADSLQLATLGQATLSDYMQQNTTVYIKESGNKMMASVSFRGTGSTHTGVFWHGINLNSLTLGGADFNGFPLFLFDDIAVHYGGSSSVHGSDAIGGSIHLGSIPSWTNGSKVQLRQDLGSFGNVFTGIKVNIGNGKWESKTRVFNRQLKNNFTYNITDRIGITYDVKQKNAEVYNYGLLQEYNRKIYSNGFLSLKGWMGKNYHQIQPMKVTSPDQDQNGDEIWDRNLKIIGNYDHYFSSGTLQTSLGYVWDYQLFNESDLIETTRLLSNLCYEWNVSKKTIFKAGGSTKFIKPNVWSYAEDLTEWRGDVFISVNQALAPNWQLSANGRKTFVPSTQSPIAPSLSTSYVIGTENTRLTFRGQLERSYRVPTFNDRYWGDQGKPDLKAEHGYSAELGQHLHWQKGRQSFEFDIDAFYMIVDDWILWKKESYISPITGKELVNWRPDNLKKVEASGIELDGKYKWQLSRASVQLGAMYAYNKTILLEGVSDNDQSVGFQLPYTPRHRFGMYSNLTYRKWRLSVNNNFTGTRKGNDVINEEIDDFFITNITLSKNFLIGRQVFSLEGQAMNVFNVDYQNVNRYAMPGRNYLISFNYIFN